MAQQNLTSPPGAAPLASLRAHPVLVASLLAVAMLLAETIAFHAAIWPRPVPWLSWADQGHYLDSAFAWAHGDLNPAKHNYPPGYALMAVPFTWLMPWQPFAIPDALCLLASLYLFTRLAARLLPPALGWRIAAPLVFVVATTRLKILREIWFTPWTTTAAAPLQMLALLLALRVREAPGGWRAAQWGLCLGVLAGIRPVDAALLGVVTGAFVMAPPWAGAREAGRCLAAAAGGFLAAAGPLAFLHLAAHHFSPGQYLSGSAGIGFEWRLLPLRWVLLVVDSRPLVAESAGMAERIWWFAPGVAGLVFCCIAGGARRAAWRLLAAALALHVGLYLCYRDLEPGGLWRFHNVHYFKWIFPFLLLAACRLVMALGRPGDRMTAAVCVLAVAPLFLLRAEFVPVSTEMLVRDGNSYALPGGFADVWQAAWLPLQGTWYGIYGGRPTLESATRQYRHVADFRLFPEGGGAMLLPLRPLPAGGLRFVPASGTQLDAAKPSVFGTIRIRFALPCGMDPACE